MSASIAKSRAEPRERGILFSAKMVRALLERKKTQTRRIVKPQPINDWLGYMMLEPGLATLCGPDYPDAETDEVRCPFGAPGDRLWVRETWDAPPGSNARSEVSYRADFDRDPAGARWTPAIHMPRWASRILLEITEVRVERVRDISADDAIAEGIDPGPHRCGCDVCSRTSALCPATQSSLIAEYGALWDAINGERAPWASNPWVWVVAFRRAA